ncbi:MAG: LytTR family DNA-binding domain-containing protein [Lachnospiraceae bacterium]|nr:LytTR family DNA-binding domain-containing protein [Lachnospiraceae bacterium]
MIKIAIVEDEDLYVKVLSEFLDRFQAESGTAICSERFRDGDEIVENYDGSYDIILMDIQMKFMDGMSAAEEIRKRDRDVIIMFITNRTDYAIRGYEVDALDYIVKPVNYFAFARKLERAIGRIPQDKDAVITLNIPQGIRKIRIDDIFYAESEGHNLVYHTVHGDYKIRQKMSEAEEELGRHGFFRSNKGYLVNMRHVDGVQDGCCLLAGQRLLISRSRKAEFMAAMADYIGSMV